MPNLGAGQCLKVGAVVGVDEQVPVFLRVLENEGRSKVWKVSLQYELGGLGTAVEPGSCMKHKSL